MAKSKTVRISQRLYDAIDEARTDDQTFEEFIEEMAKEYGLLPEGVRNPAVLRKKLKNVYGFDEGEVDSVLETLKAIYTGQEKSSTIGYPHAEVEEKYGRENVSVLKRLGLVKEHHYTGKYDFGYETTAIGEKIASQVVNEYLNETKSTIRKRLSEYEDRMLSFLLLFGFERTDTGHYSTRGASLTLPSDELFHHEEIQKKYDQLKRDLSELGVAEQHSEGSFTILPPEFADFFAGTGRELREVLEQIEVYKVIRDYVNDDIETREELLSKLDYTNEPRLQDLINGFYEEGLTSKYVQKDIPFLIKDQDALFEKLQDQISHALK